MNPIPICTNIVDCWVMNNPVPATWIGFGIVAVMLCTVVFCRYMETR